MLEIKGLRIRSSSNVKTVLVDSLNIKFIDILSADWRNGSIYLQVSNDKIENMIVCENDMKPRHYSSKLCIRKVRDCAYDNEKYSDTFFKINKIPIHWNVNDVVKYFQVSCNAPLRFCYRLNKDPDHVSTQYAFVEFIASESANKARNILERNRFNHCLGMKPIEENEVRKILQHHRPPLYSHSIPNKMDHKRHSNDIDNNGGTRAFGSCSVKRNRNRNGRHLLDVHNHRNSARHSKSNHSNAHRPGSTLNGDRIKRKLKGSIHRSYRRNRKHARSNSSYEGHRQRHKRHRHHAKNKKTHPKNRKHELSKSSTKERAAWNSTSKTVQLTVDSSDSECSSFSDYSSNDSYCSSCLSTDDEEGDEHDDDYKAKDNKEIEEGEIQMKQSKKLRHITSKSLSTKLRKIRNNFSQRTTEPAAPSLSASPSIASCTSPVHKSNTESPAKSDRLNAIAVDDLLPSANDKLIIFGYDICSAAEIKQVTKKIERSAQFIHATVISDQEIISVWNNVISFFTRFPNHYVLHLDYVVSLISSLIKYHSYLIPLSSFLGLPISCLLELCTGNSIKIIEEFLNIPCQRFHQQFQNILIHNIDAIVSHNAGADLIKLSFRKLCKASLYNIVQIIDQKNYKQLSKELIPIIKNRQNGSTPHMPQKQATFNGIVQSKTINSMTTNIILSPMSSSQSLQTNNNRAPPPPPPRKQDANELKISKKHKLNDMVYPARKKQKIKDSKPLDPRLIHMAKPMNVVYKRWKSPGTMMVFQWSINTHVIIRNVENCIDKIMEARMKSMEIRRTLTQNVMTAMNALPESFKDQYGFGRHLKPYLDSINDKNGKRLDAKFYYSLFDVMQIVFQIPDPLYTVIEINDVNTNIMRKLRSVCKEETVLFINTNSDGAYIHNFCICSPRLGIVQFDVENGTDLNSNAFANRLQQLISINENNADFDSECSHHFKCIYTEWKSKGIHCEYAPKHGTNAFNLDTVGMNNAVIAYLYLILDICHMDYNKIRDEYVKKVLDISQSASLSLRVLYFLFEDVKKLDTLGKTQKIKPNLYREVVAINGF